MKLRWLAARGPLVALLAFGVLAGGCGPAARPSSDAAVQVVATTTVLADLVARVGGARISVSALVPRGGEVHTFDPRPSDLTRVATADLVILNGLGLDDWLVGLVEDVGSDATVVRLGEAVPTQDLIGPTGGPPNPHLWLDVTFARRYVERIAEALTGADPAGATAYRANAVTTDASLAALDAWARDRLAAVPPADRRLVSFHDAFPYLARAYDLTIVGVAVEAPGQEPSAGEIAALIDAIRDSGARAIFSEAQFSPRLAEAIAAETGATVVADLYSDTLGDPPVDSYEGLIRWDVERIVAGLTGDG